MKHLFFFFLSIVLFFQGFAQQPEQQPDNLNVSPTPAAEALFGKLIDQATGKPIDAASVQVYVRGTNTDSLYDGMLTRPNGEFRIEKLPETDSIKLVISALGYQTSEQIIKRATAAERGGFQRDLGNIGLQTDVKQLSEVVVSSTRSALEMGIDRKIFDVSKSLLATGGTAVDIMKNIPSVSVDIEGNVELRNSTPQIFVDGRPTILTLDQIPADHIDKIELITNPSAKFDAASSGGIINVVLKKNKRVGLNGVVSLSGGTPELFSGNLTLNLRQGKFNFFANAGINQSGGVARGHTLRQNKNDGVVTDYFNQFSENERDRDFSSVRFGTDIFITNRNTITLSQDFSKGTFGNFETQDQEYLDSNQVLTYSGLRLAEGSAQFNRGSTRAIYKHSFPREGKEFTADVNYNYGTRSSLSAINTNYSRPDGSEYRPPSYVWNDGSSEEKQLTIQADYVNPINESTKIEAGARSFTSKFTSYYNAYAYDNGQPEKLPLSNNYAYDQSVTAVYFTFSKRLKAFSYQVGLRGEHSLFDGELVDSGYKFGYEYPEQIKDLWNGLFPSLYLTKKLGEEDELQFNYTRRIRRPQFWQLNPFVDINDPANLRQGNPALRPEFINSFELNYNKNYKQGSFLGVLYFRSNPDDITQYSDTITAAQYQQFANAAIDPNAILNTFINANTTNRYGAELTLQQKFGTRFDITPTINLQYRTVSANVDNVSLDNEGFNWEAKLISNYRIETADRSFFNNLGFQLLVEYESPQVIPQGKQIAEFQVDAAIRKDFLKNKKASLTLAVSDLFNSNRWGTIYDTDQFYQDSYRRWNVRNFRLTFSYKFGDTKFSLFNNNRGGRNNDDD